ncbi:MAG: hypothetical protein ACK41T_07775 [Pseudobdellovibrio sp.]
MLKKYDPKFSKGSLFICTKCGKDFSKSDSERAEDLKKDLRSELKEFDAHKKIRVMVSGCLGVCIKDEQAFAYYPNDGREGNAEVYTTTSDYKESKQDILDFIKSKVT